VAAALSVSAEGDFTAQVSGHALKRDFGLVMDLMADVLRRPSFPQAELEKARQQRLAVYEQQRDDPGSRASRDFQRAVFPPGHPLRTPSLDEAEAGVKAITRDDAVAFYHQHYTPDSMILAIAGDVTAAEAKAAVEK